MRLFAAASVKFSNHRDAATINRLSISPGSEKDITEVSGTSSPGSTPGRGTFIARIA